MRVVQVSKAGEWTLPEVPRPHFDAGEVLVAVHAVGVTPSELEWYPTTHTAEGGVRESAVPGHEFSGIVEAVGASVQGLAPGDAVFGTNDWFATGATADFCVAPASSLAHKPESLSHERAATVPISALTAWQGLIERAHIREGERVLVIGGGGAVGLYAVQLAHLHGAHVVATASDAEAELVRSLGATQVVDFRKSGADKTIEPVDVVFDTVGGDALERAWRLLQPEGRVVTVAAAGENTRDARTRDAFFIVEPSREQLIQIAGLLDAGRLQALLGGIVPFEDAASAYTNPRAWKRGPGKLVISVTG